HAARRRLSDRRRLPRPSDATPVLCARVEGSRAVFQIFSEGVGRAKRAARARRFCVGGHALPCPPYGGLFCETERTVIPILCRKYAERENFLIGCRSAACLFVVTMRERREHPMIEFKPRFFVLPAIAVTVLAMLH